MLKDYYGVLMEHRYLCLMGIIRKAYEKGRVDLMEIIDVEDN
jgi:hypothetical protein